MITAMTDVRSELALFELLSLERRVNSYGTTTYHNGDGQLHRLYGPAIEYADGGRAWYQNDQRHRVDGPAAEWPDGYRAWYINGKLLSEAEWLQAVASMENV